MRFFVCVCTFKSTGAQCKLVKKQNTHITTCDEMLFSYADVFKRSTPVMAVYRLSFACILHCKSRITLTVSADYSWCISGECTDFNRTTRNVRTSQIVFMLFFGLQMTHINPIILTREKVCKNAYENMCACKKVSLVRKTKVQKEIQMHTHTYTHHFYILLQSKCYKQ